jgi:hypothetical protein
MGSAQVSSDGGSHEVGGSCGCEGADGEGGAAQYSQVPRQITR